MMVTKTLILSLFVISAVSAFTPHRKDGLGQYNINNARTITIAPVTYSTTSVSNGHRVHSFNDRRKLGRIQQQLRMILDPNDVSVLESIVSTSSTSTLLAIDPITIGGISLAVNDLVFLLAPLPAVLAGIFSLSEREKIQKEIATTEKELLNIKERLTSSNLQINVSFAAAAFSLALATGNLINLVNTPKSSTETASVSTTAMATKSLPYKEIKPSSSTSTISTPVVVPELTKSIQGLIPSKSNNIEIDIKKALVDEPMKEEVKSTMDGLLKKLETSVDAKKDVESEITPKAGTDIKSKDGEIGKASVAEEESLKDDVKVLDGLFKKLDDNNLETKTDENKDAPAVTAEIVIEKKTESNNLIDNLFKKNEGTTKDGDKSDEKTVAEATPTVEEKKTESSLFNMFKKTDAEEVGKPVPTPSEKEKDKAIESLKSEVTALTTLMKKFEDTIATETSQDSKSSVLPIPLIPEVVKSMPDTSAVLKTELATVDDILKKLDNLPSPTPIAPNVAKKTDPDIALLKKELTSVDTLLKKIETSPTPNSQIASDASKASIAASSKLNTELSALNGLLQKVDTLATNEVLKADNIKNEGSGTKENDATKTSSKITGSEKSATIEKEAPKTGDSDKKVPTEDIGRNDVKVETSIEPQKEEITKPKVESTKQDDVIKADTVDKSDKKASTGAVSIPSPLPVKDTPKKDAVEVKAAPVMKVEPQTSTIIEDGKELTVILDDSEQDISAIIAGTGVVAIGAGATIFLISSTFDNKEKDKSPSPVVSTAPVAPPAPLNGDTLQTKDISSKSNIVERMSGGVAARYLDGTSELKSPQAAKPSSSTSTYNLNDTKGVDQTPKTSPPTVPASSSYLETMTTTVSATEGNEAANDSATPTSYLDGMAKPSTASIPSKYSATKSSWKSPPTSPPVSPSSSSTVSSTVSSSGSYLDGMVKPTKTSIPSTYSATSSSWKSPPAAPPVSSEDTTADAKGWSPSSSSTVSSSGSYLDGMVKPNKTSIPSTYSATSSSWKSPPAAPPVSSEDTTADAKGWSPSSSSTVSSSGSYLDAMIKPSTTSIPSTYSATSSSWKSPPAAPPVSSEDTTADTKGWSPSSSSTIASSGSYLDAMAKPSATSIPSKYSATSSSWKSPPTPPPASSEDISVEAKGWSPSSSSTVSSSAFLQNMSKQAGSATFKTEQPSTPSPNTTPPFDQSTVPNNSNGLNGSRNAIAPPSYPPSPVSTPASASTSSTTNEGGSGLTGSYLDGMSTSRPVAVPAKYGATSSSWKSSTPTGPPAIEEELPKPKGWTSSGSTVSSAAFLQNMGKQSGSTSYVAKSDPISSPVPSTSVSSPYSTSYENLKETPSQSYQPPLMAPSVNGFVDGMESNNSPSIPNTGGPSSYLDGMSASGSTVAKQSKYSATSSSWKSSTPPPPPPPPVEEDIVKPMGWTKTGTTVSSAAFLQNMGKGKQQTLNSYSSQNPSSPPTSDKPADPDPYFEYLKQAFPASMDQSNQRKAPSGSSIDQTFNYNRDSNRQGDQVMPPPPIPPPPPYQTNGNYDTSPDTQEAESEIQRNGNSMGGASSYLSSNSFGGNNSASIPPPPPKPKLNQSGGMGSYLDAL